MAPPRVGRRGAVATVTGLGFLVVMGSEAVTPVLAIEARAMGASVLAVGAMFPSLYAVRFVVGPAIGVLSDRKGLRWTLVACVLLGPVVPLVYALAPTFGWLVMGRILSGVISSAFSPTSLRMRRVDYLPPISGMTSNRFMSRRQESGMTSIRSIPRLPDAFAHVVQGAHDGFSTSRRSTPRRPPHPSPPSKP